ncbi:MAG: Flp family type IVb pilin [Maricaulaceae bacterium]|jgi:pilus assembly protein Flp/PilA
MRDDRGATAIEYGLLAALMAVALLVALENFADATIAMWERVAGEMQTATGTG